MRDEAFPLLASSIERPLKTELSPLIKKKATRSALPAAFDSSLTANNGATHRINDHDCSSTLPALPESCHDHVYRPLSL